MPHARLRLAVVAMAATSAACFALALWRLEQVHWSAIARVVLLPLAGCLVLAGATLAGLVLLVLRAGWRAALLHATTLLTGMLLVPALVAGAWFLLGWLSAL